MTNHEIDEELRNYKLFKIQETEAKLRKFNAKYEQIKQHLAIKISKNISSNLARIVLIVLALLFLGLSLVCFFPETAYQWAAEEPPQFTREDKLTLDISKYIFLLIALFLCFTSYLLKVNNRKRNHIYSLAILLEEVMEYMENTREEDKKKYEQFVDLIAERDIIAKKKSNQNTL